jgi:glycosyltransferase involved in cell wall biosynthesis
LSVNDSLLSNLLSENLSYNEILSQSTGLTTENGIKVVHLCWMDSAGAGGAAYRLHNGLRTIGVDSKMIVLFSMSRDPTVLIPPLSYDGNIQPSISQSSFGAMSIVRNDRRWSLLASQYPSRRKNSELFTDPFADLRPEFIKEIREADIVNLHWVAGMIDYPTFDRALAGKIIVWTMHDMNPFTGGCHYSDQCEKYCDSCGACPNLNSSSDEDISRYFHRIKFRAFAHRRIFPVSPSRWLAQCSQKSSLLGNFPHKVIPNGFPTSVFVPGGRQQIRARYFIEPSSRLVLFGAASISIERKGFRYLREALEKLFLEKLDFKIVLGIFGAAVDDSVLKNLPFPVVCFGHISEQKILAQIYSAADVYVLPTLADNLPNTLIEAMSCGCPSVAFNTGGVPDIIQHRQNGWLAEPRDVQGLTEGIKWVLSESFNKPELSEKLRRTSVEKFDEKVQAESYRSYYIEIIKSVGLEKQLCKKADTAFTSGYYAEAESIYLKIPADSIFSSHANYNLGRIFSEKHNISKAVEHLKLANTSNPSDIEIIKKLVECLIEEGNFSEAADTVSVYLDHNPVNTEMLQLFAHAQKKHIQDLYSSSFTRQNGFKKSDSRITVIISVSHSGIFLEDLLNDLKMQTFSDKLQIIITSTSSDKNQFDFLENQIISEKNIRFIIPSNPVGFYQSLNLGLYLTGTPYCFICSCGDRLVPDCIETLAGTLDNSNSAAVFGNTILTDSHCRDISNYTSSEFGNGLLDRSLIHGNLLFEEYGLSPHVMWRRELNNEYGLFDQRYQAGADQDMWIKFARKKQLTHVPVTTGLVWLDEKLIKTRFTRTLRQFASVRQKYRLFPFSANGSINITQDEQKLLEANKILEEIIRLAEKGKNAEIFKLYDSSKKLFECLPESRKIHELVEKLRIKNHGYIDKRP